MAVLQLLPWAVLDACAIVIPMVPQSSFVYPAFGGLSFSSYPVPSSKQCYTQVSVIIYSCIMAEGSKLQVMAGYTVD